MCFRSSSYCEAVREWLWNSRAVWSCNPGLCTSVVHTLTVLWHWLRVSARWPMMSFFICVGKKRAVLNDSKSSQREKKVSIAYLWCSYHCILSQSPLFLFAWHDELLNALWCFQQECMCSANTVHRIVFQVPRFYSSYQVNLLRFEWRVSTCFNMCNNDTVMFCVASTSMDSRFSLGGPDDCMFILTLYRCFWYIQNAISTIIFLNTVLIGVNRYVFKIQTLSKATYTTSTFFYDSIWEQMLYPGQVVVTTVKVKQKQKCELCLTMASFISLIKDIIASNECNLVDRGAHDKRQIGTHKADDNPKAKSIPHWHKQYLWWFRYGCWIETHTSLLKWKNAIDTDFISH